MLFNVLRALDKVLEENDLEIKILQIKLDNLQNKGGVDNKCSSADSGQKKSPEIFDTN